MHGIRYDSRTECREITLGSLHFLLSTYVRAALALIHAKLSSKEQSKLNTVVYNRRNNGLKDGDKARSAAAGFSMRVRLDDSITAGDLLRDIEDRDEGMIEFEPDFAKLGQIGRRAMVDPFYRIVLGVPK